MSAAVIACLFWIAGFPMAALLFMFLERYGPRPTLSLPEYVAIWPILGLGALARFVWREVSK